MTDAPFYAELQVASAFSFLRGASHPNELVTTAAALRLPAIGIADRNTVAGVVRAHEAVRQVNKQGGNIRLLVGSRLAFRDGTPDMLCYPTDRTAWGRLTRLLSTGKLRAKKGECDLDHADLAEHASGQVLIVLPPDRLDAGFQNRLKHLAGEHRGQLYLAASRRHRGDDAQRLRALAELAARNGLQLVATNDVLYHTPERRPLQDVLTCIRLGCTIEEAGLLLQPNAERHLKSAAEMARLFRAYPDAIAATKEIVKCCRFSLTDLSYEYPDEPVPPGLTPDEHLANLTWKGAQKRYPAGVPDDVAAQLDKELRLISTRRYARYFLTVHDIVRYAESKNILCQGRGSAANSAVCYCLGVTAVDPKKINLLFERFISADREEPPDIDVDFEHERREDVIQYVYKRYGRDRAGITATVIHYRPKRAIREVGKVLGLADDATAALSAQSWHAGANLWNDEHVRQAGLDPESPAVRRAVTLARELVGLPRHLSQHVGGFVLTRDRLDETVPIGNAAMKDRTFIEWDKDDLDALRLMKVDVLALGMLTCIRKAFAIIGKKDLAEIPQDDPAVYRMLSRGDSLGVFQVESRAQMNMLPRLKPKEFYDLVIEVAIVRPGPIQGDMVHPYLRRRQQQEKRRRKIDFPSPSPDCGPADELASILERTLGVPLFQEQAMQIALVAAGFKSEEVNGLRRSMATFRNAGTIHEYGAKLVDGMTRRGYDRAFAEACFRQIKGFGEYGFPESHAASFALLVYVSAWLKCHHPAVFACALLNSQPMGFYAPAQIVRDAREHGVTVRGVDVNASLWDCSIEKGGALRLGFRMINGFSEKWTETLVESRGTRYADFTALARSGLKREALMLLAEADALRSLGMDRRAGLWAVRGLREDQALPLFAHLADPATDVRLPPMRQSEHVIADYQTTGLSLKAHPLSFLRRMLACEGAYSCAEAAQAPDGAYIRVAGLVLVRQRPGSAEGVVFATIEDETGIANIVIWPSLLDRFRKEVLGTSLLMVDGQIQRSPEGVVHVVADILHDRSTALAGLADDVAPPRSAHADETPAPRAPRHPRAERPIQRSRDFH